MEATNRSGQIQEGSPVKFSTFGGVFTPSILTIFGVIMFMRAGMVIGEAGIAGALFILLISKSITLFTGFSISAIATNTEVKSGGAYFLISRTLGPEFGGAIGLALYAAQALSVPFYILGFSEALVKSVGSMIPSLSMEVLNSPVPYLGTWFSIINFSILIILFIVSFIGADWAIKTQYIIMAVLGLAIAAFLGGAALRFNIPTFQSNWISGYSGNNNFWIVFAIYFPAATGIMAGVNMSGNLKDPTKSLPMGTILAIATGLFVYAGQILLLGGAVERSQLIARPFHTLLDVSNINVGFMTVRLGFLVVMGVICATLSSAIGSFLGAPRVLQALAQDKILKPFTPFAKLSKKGEPHRALWITFVISAAVLYYARNSGGGGALNSIASIITMLFLCTYGITNLAAFVESFGRNPSFRPRFRFFHWSIALLGALGCLFAAFLINALTAMFAIFIISLLFLYVRKFILTSSFGDARRGFYYSRARDNLFMLSQMPIHAKNWRPTILVLSGNPNTRFGLVKYANWLGSGRGIVTMASFITGNFYEKLSRRKEELAKLDIFIEENNLQAFSEVLVTPNFDVGLFHLLQCSSLSPVKPNLIIWGWSKKPSRAAQNIKNMKIAYTLGISQIIVSNPIPPSIKARHRKIDIWWRGKKNGSLMVILGYLLSLNSEWSGCTIRILRVVSNRGQVMYAESELKKMMDSARMSNTKIEIIVSEKKFPEILKETSVDSAVVFLGFEIPEVESTPQFQRGYSMLLESMPTTFLVNSTGEADLIS